MMSQLKTAGRKEFTLLVKGDVQGSVEAIIGALDKAGNEEVMARVIDAPLLVPGLGAQGGEVTALGPASRLAPSVINVSRGILYADPDTSFEAKARRWAGLIADQWR